MLYVVLICGAFNLLFNKYIEKIKIQTVVLIDKNIHFGVFLFLSPKLT